MARSWGRLLARIAGYGFLVLLVLAALGITFTIGWRPLIGAKKRALTSRKFEVTPARLQRGDYLVHAVMHCMGCHAKFDVKANPPVLLSKEGAGQVLFEEGDLRIIAPNITSISPSSSRTKRADVPGFISPFTSVMKSSSIPTEAERAVVVPPIAAPMVAPVRRRIPSARAIATSALTAPRDSMISAGTSTHADFSVLL